MDLRKHDYWSDNESPLCKVFAQALTHHSCAIEGSKLTEDETNYIMALYFKRQLTSAGT